MDMYGEYRLLRQGGGRGAFAHVYVQVIPWNHPTNQVVAAVNPAETATITPEQDPEWFTAAIQGVHDALRALHIYDDSFGTYQVQITQIVINVVDTASDAVRAAAFLATVGAFGKQEAFRLVFQDEWTVEPIT